MLKPVELKVYEGFTDSGQGPDRDGEGHELPDPVNKRVAISLCCELRRIFMEINAESQPDHIWL